MVLEAGEHQADVDTSVNLANIHDKNSYKIAAKIKQIMDKFKDNDLNIMNRILRPREVLLKWYSDTKNCFVRENTLFTPTSSRSQMPNPLSKI